MNLNIFYEPYVFSFILSIIISIGWYLYQRYNIEDIEDMEESKNKESSSFVPNAIIVLLLSYIIIMILYYSYKYISTESKGTFSSAILAGGALSSKTNNVEKEINIEEMNNRREKMMERLTIVDDDVDVSILED
jgi:hypothetical protein